MHIDWTNIEVDQLPDPFREIAHDIGLEMVRYLVEAWGGTVLYIPTLNGLTRKQIDERILKAYNGKNEYSLAREFGVSRARIRRAIGK